MSETAAGRRVLVLGGTSEIALAIVRELQAGEPREVLLAGRDEEGLERAAGELREAGCASVASIRFDARETEGHGELVDRAFARLGGAAEIVILAVGVLGERGGLPRDVLGAVEVLETNTVGAGSLLLHAAARLREAGGGSVLVLSSVAAERPRRANAVYGASKAALDSLAQALADELRENGVRVVVLRPGFVRTRMTSGLPPAPLATTPEAVARCAVRALAAGRPTAWAPASLRWLMLAMRMIPRPIFRKMRQ